MPLFAHTVRRRAAAQAGGFAALVGLAFLLCGCQSPEARDYEPVVPQFLLETPSQVRGALVVQLPRSGVLVVVSPAPVFSEIDVRNVELVKVDLGLCLMFEFTPDGARALTRLSSGNLGRRLVVTLNGQPFGARLLDGPIFDGRLMVFVELSDDELTRTAVNLKRTAHEIQTALAEGRRKKT